MGYMDTENVDGSARVPAPAQEALLTDKDLVTQIETYSNAIVAFAVLQALSYLYAFGTSELFNCLVKTLYSLAWSLSLSFVVVGVLLIVALNFLGKQLIVLSGKHAGIVKKIYVAKSVSVFLATLMQVTITVMYGVYRHQEGLLCGVN